MQFTAEIDDPAHAALPQDVVDNAQNRRKPLAPEPSSSGAKAARGRHRCISLAGEIASPPWQSTVEHPARALTA
jgi:hypothetical protein